MVTTTSKSSGVCMLLVLAALAGCGRADDGASASDGALVVTGHCQVTAMGVMPGGEGVTGSIVDVAGTPSGTWQSATPSDGLVGSADWLECRVNGATVADFTGTGSWNGSPGYTFRVHVQDRGTPGAPVRVEAGPTTTTVEATRTYSPSRWTDGVASFDAGAYVTIPASLPVTVGDAGGGWAWATFAPDPGWPASLAYPVRCRYRGASGGASYAFVDCQRPCADAHDDDRDDEVDEHGHEWHHGGYEHGGRLYARGDDHHACGRDDDDGEEDEWCTDPAILAGAQLEVSSATVHVQTGSNRSPSRAAARTTVSVTLADTPFILVAPENDFYRLGVWDSSGTLVHTADGDLSSGDITVTLLP